MTQCVHGRKDFRPPAGGGLPCHPLRCQGPGLSDVQQALPAGRGTCPWGCGERTTHLPAHRSAETGCAWSHDTSAPRGGHRQGSGKMVAWDLRASQMELLVKNPPTNAGDFRDASSIPGSRRSPGGGHGNPLQDSCLENPMDRGARWGTVHGRKDGHD